MQNSQILCQDLAQWTVTVPVSTPEGLTEKKLDGTGWQATLLHLSNVPCIYVCRSVFIAFYKLL